MSATEPQASALVLLQRGLHALAASDWDALRSLCDDQIVWRVPGRSPLAGELVGPDAVVARFQQMRQATSSDRPATLVAVLEAPTTPPSCNAITSTAVIRLLTQSLPSRSQERRTGG